MMSGSLIELLGGQAETSESREDRLGDGDDGGGGGVEALVTSGRQFDGVRLGNASDPLGPVITRSGRWVCRKHIRSIGSVLCYIKSETVTLYVKSHFVTHVPIDGERGKEGSSFPTFT